MAMVCSRPRPFVIVAMSLCAAATPQLAHGQFTEEAVARGIDYLPVDPTTAYGGGVAFADLNNDGFPDIICLGDFNGKVGIFENDGTGHFADRSATSGIPLLKGASGLCAGDYNNDGLLDIYVTRIMQPNALLRNDGNFTFTNVAADVGVAHVGIGQGCSWADYQGDGRLDLAVSNYTQPNIVFRNLPNGQFANVTSAIGASTGSDNSLQMSFWDYDLDAAVDLFVLHDAQGTGCTQGPNHLLRNVGGLFDDVTDESGMHLCIDSMTLSVGDLNLDGWPDVFISNTFAGHALMCSNGDGTFTRSDADAGVTVAGTWGWGGAMFDYDNDGLLDLYLCLGDSTNRLFHGSATWPLVDVAEAMGVDSDKLSYTVAVADIDNDGDLDMLLHDWAFKIRLFVNNHSEPSTWIKFDVRGKGAQRQAIGARIELRTGTDWQLRQIIAGANFKSQDDLVQHFGLGLTPIVDEVIVTWPGGSMRTLTNLSPNATWTIHPTEKLGDANGDGRVNFTDFLALANCYGVYAPGAHVPGCELMDFDGDCDLDEDDLAAFFDRYADPLADCNDNAVPDLQEILLGQAADLDGDWAIDSCSGAPLPGDLDGNGIVGLGDLLLVISDWGCESCDPACAGDADDDCLVGLADLLVVISNWGATGSG